MDIKFLTLDAITKMADQMDATSDQVITLRWFHLTPEESSSGLLTDALNPEAGKRTKKLLLDRLKITQQPDESFSDAWLRTMCEENKLPNVRPVARSLADAITSNPGALRFYSFLI